MPKFSSYTVSPTVLPVDTFLIHQVSSNAEKQITLSTLKNTIFSQISSIADLRALDVSLYVADQVVSVLGYYSINDGGQGEFYYDPLSVAAENNGTIIRPASGIGRWYRILDGTLNVKFFGATGDGVTSDTAAFAAALLIGGAIIVPAGTYKLGELTVSVAKTRLICEPDVTLNVPVLGVGNAAIKVTADDFAIFGFPKLFGPFTGVYVADENGIEMVGTSSLNRLSGLTLEVEVSNFGSGGIFAKWTNNIDIRPDSYVHDCGYTGMQFLSCTRGKIIGTRVEKITPGTAGNAYGITLTHDTTGYNLDPNAGTKQALNPFCQDWDILANFVEEVPVWVGIDAHGAYGVRASNNNVYNCKGGIHIAGSSGDAAGYAGWDNEVTYNLVDSRKSTGLAGTSPNLGLGINVAGGATLYGRRLWVVGNTVYGYGIVSNSGGTPSISAEATVGAVVSGNVVESWGGVGINIDDATDVLVEGNTFHKLANPADTVAMCIRNQIASATRQRVLGNSIDEDTGTAAREGFRTAATTRPMLGGNDFKAATSDQFVSTSTSNFHNGGDRAITKGIDLGAGGGTTTLDLAELVWGAKEIILYLTAGAAIAISNITGLKVGTKVMLIVQNGSSNITFTRATAALAGGVDFVGGSYDTLALVCYASSGGVQWVELSRASNS